MVYQKMHGKRLKISENSISLVEYGINDLAWTRENAKILIKSILEDEIGILGGAFLS